MAAVEEITLLSQVSSVLEENGLEGIASCVAIVINEAMRIECSRELNAQPYQRIQGRRGYANGVEQINREVLRRTRVAGLFPDTDSLLRICSAILMEISEEWETGKTYIKLS